MDTKVRSLFNDDAVAIQPNGIMTGNLGRVITVPQDPEYSRYITQLKDRYYVGIFDEIKWYCRDHLDKPLFLDMQQEDGMLCLTWNPVGISADYDVYAAFRPPNIQQQAAQNWHRPQRDRQSYYEIDGQFGIWIFNVLASDFRMEYNYGSCLTYRVIDKEQGEIIYDDSAFMDSMLRDSIPREVVNGKVVSPVIVESSESSESDLPDFREKKLAEEAVLESAT